LVTDIGRYGPRHAWISPYDAGCGSTLHGDERAFRRPISTAMKLITFENAGDTPVVGALIAGGQSIVDLSAGFGSMLALIDAGERGLEVARELVSRADRRLARRDVRLLAPIPEPRQLRDAMCFEQHYRQGMRGMAQLRAGRLLGRAAVALGAVRIPRVWYQQPTYYKCNRFSVVGDGADVIWPQGAKLMDYESEVAVVIGKTGKDIPRESALSHVFGYTLFNDMTARDLQEREMRGMLGPAKGKDFDTGNVLGPCIATADELTDPYALTLEARVNGELWGTGSSRDMYHRWDQVIAYISRSETLYAGEVIGSGTVPNGCGLEVGRYLPEGALVEISANGIGTLTNRLVRP
jgi:2-keto-4-pentenoate hydratase/2-oxohepta-3-ene-1,7-dioic acid hydratase in catechol pathway